MTQSINSDEADRLASQLAAVTGESVTEAVVIALQQRLARERAARRAGGLLLPNRLTRRELDENDLRMACLRRWRRVHGANRRLYDQMWQRAAAGSDAVALIQRVIAELRGLSSCG